MKKIIIAIVVGVSVSIGVAHLEHSASLDGYMQGCRDVIAEGAEQQGLPIPSDVVDSYCHSLLNKYEKK